MNQKARPLLAKYSRMLIVLVCLVAVVGCDRGDSKPSPAAKARTRTAGWSGAGQEGVPGLAHAELAFAEYEDELTFVLWTDTGESAKADSQSAGAVFRGHGGVGEGTDDGVFRSFRRTWDKSRNSIKYAGYFHATDGRKITFECYTTDGKTGSLNVDGKTFPLEKGILFLVSTVTGKTNVKQLKRDQTRLKGHHGALLEISQTDREIQGFFRGARPQTGKAGP